MSRSPLTLMLLLCGLLVAGCRDSGPKGRGHLMKPGRNRIRAAVIPFEGASALAEDAGRIITDEVVTALLSTDVFEIVEPGAVYSAMGDIGLRNIYGLDPDTIEQLQAKIGPVEVFVVGLVQEFSDVRIGPVTYPVVSVSARIIDGRNGEIIWSGSASRSGADTEKVFGFGAIHSRSKLARAVVRDLVRQVKSRHLRELLAMAARPAPPGRVEAPPERPEPVGPTGEEKYFDETAVYSEAQLRALLADVPGLQRGPVTYRQHHYSIVEAAYEIEGAPLDVKLVDYRTVEACKGFVAHRHPREEPQDFDGLPAYFGPSESATPGAYHLDVAVGRLGLFIVGPASLQRDVEGLARALIAGME